MENIKFVKAITAKMKRKYVEVGNSIYFSLDNGNIAKAYCYEYGVHINIINKLTGNVDNVDLPFSIYFKPTQCSPDSPLWYQRIKKDKWNFEKEYVHVLPTVEDYKCMSKAMETYIGLFE